MALPRAPPRTRSKWATRRSAAHAPRWAMVLGQCCVVLLSATPKATFSSKPRCAFHPSVLRAHYEWPFSENLLLPPHWSQSAYPAESVTLKGQTFHKACFKCSECAVRLTLTTYKVCCCCRRFRDHVHRSPPTPPLSCTRFVCPLPLPYFLPLPSSPSSPTYLYDHQSVRATGV